jgi:hypothetical protein
VELLENRGGLDRPFSARFQSMSFGDVKAETQHPEEPRGSAPHLRLKIKIYPDHEPTRAEVAEICRQVREFCAALSPAFHPTVDIMEGYGMGHADQ